MAVLTTHVDPRSEEARSNVRQMRAQVATAPDDHPLPIVKDPTKYSWTFRLKDVHMFLAGTACAASKCVHLGLERTHRLQGHFGGGFFGQPGRHAGTLEAPGPFWWANRR